MGSFGVFERKGGEVEGRGDGILSKGDGLEDALGYECGWKSKGAGIDLALSHI